MHRQIPMANKICFQKNIERDMEIHRDKVKNIKCSIDKGQPKALQFLSEKNKKTTAQSLARNEEIERENNILLRKITNIMQTGQGCIKNSLKKSQSFSQFGNRKVKSLNSEVRKRDLVKIVIENQAILKRIQNKKSQYNHKQWEDDRKVTEKYINNKCEYQYKNYQPTQTQVKLGMWGSKENSIQGSQMNSRKNLTGKNFKLKPIEHKAMKQIFKTTRKIGMDYYYIDVKVIKGVFSIVLDNIEKSNQRYTIELLEKEGMTIWKKECQQKPELLLERVRVDERSKTVFFRRINDQISISRENLNDNFYTSNNFYPQQKQQPQDIDQGVHIQEDTQENRQETEIQQQQQQDNAEPQDQPQQQQLQENQNQDQQQQIQQSPQSQKSKSPNTSQLQQSNTQQKSPQLNKSTEQKQNDQSKVQEPENQNADNQQSNQNDEPQQQPQEQQQQPENDGDNNNASKVDQKVEEEKQQQQDDQKQNAEEEQQQQQQQQEQQQQQQE